MRPALLVIDVQHALCHGAFATFEADRVIARINEVAAKARAAGAPVLYVQHEAAEGPFVHGSDGWRLGRDLDAQPGDLYLRKTATDSFHKTGLQALLHDLGVDRLVVCGMQSDFCVDTTVRRALALGYPVILVEDGHTTVDNEVLPAAQISRHHTVTLANITSFGPRVTPMPAREIRFDG